MIHILTCIALASGAWLAMSAPAQAAQSYDNCTGFVASLPATISTQGTWCLDKDLSTTQWFTGNAITIATNNVTLDCNHFKIGGLAAGAGTTANGVYASARLNVTVRNCNIRGFFRGVYFDSGGGHLVEDNSFDGNTFNGITVNSSGSTIRNNLVIDTGGSTMVNVVSGIYGANGVDILDNTVNGVASAATDGNAYGIQTYLNGDRSISRNRVRGLAPAGTGNPRGIYNWNSERVIVRDNDVQGPGPSVANGIGVRCHDNTGTARGNVIAGFETGVSNCLSISNIVNPN
jgi:parallel beta-helix repeat protein